MRYVVHKKDQPHSLHSYTGPLCAKLGLIGKSAKDTYADYDTARRFADLLTEAQGFGEAFGFTVRLLNDPKCLEVRLVNGVELRVIDWGPNREPVYTEANWQEFWATLSQYKCNACADTGQVYLHGDEKEPDITRRYPVPCPWCKKK